MRLPPIPNCLEPQGSVLSPFLFALLMNTLPQYLPPGVGRLIYADDILIYTYLDLDNRGLNVLQAGVYAVLR